MKLFLIYKQKYNYCRNIGTGYLSSSITPPSIHPKKALLMLNHPVYRFLQPIQKITRRAALNMV